MKIRRRVGGIICQDKKFLLVKSNKHSQTHYYDCGGGIEKGESPLQAVHREIFEELHTSVKEAYYVKSFTYPSHCYPDIQYSEDVFIVTLLGEPKPTSEIDEIRWVSYDESKEIDIMESTRELIEIAREKNLID